MGEDLHITPALITRRYDQGVDSIIRLVTDLTSRIEDLTALRTYKPQRLILTQAATIKRLEQTLINKDAELIEAHQLNRQLQARIREQVAVPNRVIVHQADECPWLRRAACCR